MEIKEEKFYNDLDRFYNPSFGSMRELKSDMQHLNKFVVENKIDRKDIVSVSRNNKNVLTLYYWD